MQPDAPVLYAPIDVAEIDHEQQRIMDNIHILDGYRERIMQTMGVSRAQAQSLITDCNVSFPQRYPLNSFTTEPSQTNLTIAMEGMAQSAMRLLKDLLRKAAELMMKIVNWILDLLKRDRNRAKSIAKNARILTVMDEVTTKFDNLPSMDELAAQHPEIAAARNELDSAIGSYNDQFNDLYAALLNNDPIIQILREVSLSIGAALSVIQSKMNVFFHLLHDNTANPGTEELVAVGQLRGIAMPIPNQAIDRAMRRVHGLEVGESLMENMQNLNTYIRTLATSKTSHRQPDVEADARIVASSKSIFHAPIVLVEDPIIRGLETVNGQLKQLYSIEPSDLATQQEHIAFRAAINRLTEEIRAVQYFVDTAAYIDFQQDLLISRLLRYEVADFELLRQKIAVSGNRDDVQQINQATREINDEARRA